MYDLTAFLVWLIFIGISAILIIYILKYPSIEKNTKEGFVIYACPNGSTTYITKNGDTNCCNGDVVDGKCTGNNLCSLSPNNELRLSACSQLAEQQQVAVGIAKCPNAIPNYFKKSDGSLEGCSVSQITPNGQMPLDPTKLQCILYATNELDKIKLDSCYNYSLNQTALANAANCPAPAGPPAGAPPRPPAGARAPPAQPLLPVLNLNANTPATPAGPAQATSIASSMASLMSSPVASRMASLMGQAEPAASYIIYGPGISNLPVTKILTNQTPPGPIKIYLAQDGQLVRGVTVDSAYTRNISSLVFTANLSEIIDTNSAIYPLLNKYSGSYIQAPNKYNIKKSDGTGVLTPS